MAGQTAFLDSNLLLYLLSSDVSKADGVEALLLTKPVISVQVLNEVTNVCRKKLAMPWKEIGLFLATLRSFCRVVPVTEAIHDQARFIAERYRLSFYDACVVSAAMVAGCQILFTEDMHDGLIIEGNLRIKNPFAP
ncbi:MAG: PIN domain-containing protein [Pseudomonadales bacterium]|jgi:predicted nucleic acid-binding protein|nr:PIN domain-containing protein [Pseudomonadales bacterium]